MVTDSGNSWGGGVLELLLLPTSPPVVVTDRGNSWRGGVLELLLLPTSPPVVVTDRGNSWGGGVLESYDYYPPALLLWLLIVAIPGEGGY